MQDSRDNRIYTDENGDQWLTDENGKLLKDEIGDKIIPTSAKQISNDSGFTLYDDSRGHCSFCGRLNCKGDCFK